MMDGGWRIELENIHDDVDTVSTYFNGPRFLAEDKDTYKMVNEEYAHKLIDAVNNFLKENPDYEITSDKFHMKSNYNYVIFKLKEPEKIKSKTKVKD